MKKLNWFKYAALAMLGLLLAAEMGLRWLGVVDFPVYGTDDQIGYIPAPNQAGKFLNKNDWVVNAFSMGSGAWMANGKSDVLLLGDSLVWGGNSLKQIDKLGPQLEVKMNGEWRMANGEWRMANMARVRW